MSNRSTEQLQPSTIYFPLRTNTAYFDSSDAQLSLMARVKQAALLYERVVFEAGLYQCFINDQGHFSLYGKPSDTTEKMIDQSAKAFKPFGGEFQLWVQSADDDSIPPTLLLGGPEQRRYRAEFLTIFEEVNAVAPGICYFFMPPDWDAAYKSQGRDLQTVIRRQATIRLMELNHRIRSAVIENLAHDVIIGSEVRDEFNADFSVDSHYQSIVNANTAPGTITALEALVPSVSAVPWDEIADLRQEPCLIALREQIVGFEEEVGAAIVAGELSEAQRHHMLRARAVSELVKELHSRWPSFHSATSNTAIDVSLNLMSAGWYGTIWNAMRQYGAVDKYKNSWAMAVFRIHGSK